MVKIWKKKEISCFIIMPFSNTSEVHTQKYWNNHFEFFLKKYIEEIGVKLGIKIDVLRSTPIRGNISNKIIFDLTQSDIVIADLTDFNRNVIWELGVRQSFKNSTILIGEDETEKQIPFDVSKIAMITYCIDHKPKNPSFTVFLEKIESAIRDCIDNPNRSDSPVLEAMSGRATFYELITITENLRKIEGLITECVYNKGSLEASQSIIEKRQKDNTYRKVISDRLQTDSIALLMSNRYLNQDSSFYDLGADILYLIRCTDKVLEAWNYQIEQGDEYLKRETPGLMKKNFRF